MATKIKETDPEKIIPMLMSWDFNTVLATLAEYIAQENSEPERIAISQDQFQKFFKIRGIKESNAIFAYKDDCETIVVENRGRKQMTKEEKAESYERQKARQREKYAQEKATKKGQEKTDESLPF